MEIDKAELMKQNQMLSGRALYWMILHEPRQSSNTIGSRKNSRPLKSDVPWSNGSSSQELLSSLGEMLHELSMIPGDETPTIYEMQVKEDISFKRMYAVYEMNLVPAGSTSVLTKFFIRSLGNPWLLKL